MTSVNPLNKATLINTIQDAIDTHACVAEPSILKKFAAQFLDGAYVGDFQGCTEKDLANYFDELFKFYASYGKADAKVEVSNKVSFNTAGSALRGVANSGNTTISIVVKNMPFLVDSVRMVLNDLKLRIHSIQHGILYAKRSANSLSLINAHDTGAEDCAEALIYVEVDRRDNEAELKEISENLSKTLASVGLTVADYPAMLAEVNNIQASLDAGEMCACDDHERVEAIKFLAWLAENSFTFLAYVEYDIIDIDGRPHLVRIDDSRLGLFKAGFNSIPSIAMADLPEHVTNHILNPSLFLFAKSSQRSPVHRPAHADYVVVKRFDENGKVVGERRFLGLYTARVFNESPINIPFIRKKVEAARSLSGFDPRDHSGKEYDQILAVFPRDELFQLTAEQLHDSIMPTLYAQERRQVSLFVRQDAFGRFVTALVHVPRELYNTDVRQKIGRLLMQEIPGVDIEFSTYLSESALARTKFSIKVEDNVGLSIDAQRLEAQISELIQSWQENLEKALTARHAPKKAVDFVHRFRNAFNASYRESYSGLQAAEDICKLAVVNDEHVLDMSFYTDTREPENYFHLKTYHLNAAMPLSEVLPIFENMGLKVIGETPYRTSDVDGKVVYLQDFTLCNALDSAVNLDALPVLFEPMFRKVWSGEAENDRFNRLLMSSYLDWRSVGVLRSYARYMQQIRVSNSQEAIADTLIGNGGIVSLLLRLFTLRFNPEPNAERDALFTQVESDFVAALDNVPSLTEDKILRLYVSLINATLRCNYYQTDEAGQPKPYMSFKLMPSRIPDVPLPVPMFEIFVYSPRIEGVHLRGGKVARGGLRWSDRNEDYRTEVLGLVKAQQVKNAVIVPVGAKGGFVAKKLPKDDRDAFMEEGIACYKLFISGLLDLTDNLVDERVISPEYTVRHDEDDYYLVVAADKGTATFSDIANAISIERGHWLGDAFASGGSQGYDHKGMGITARGAWVSVQRHFREMGHDIQTSPFTCLGVGDMAGDVFGNGMLLSDKTRLTAAFNHMHIFLDPDPDTATSFAERKRLFALPRSSWVDYNHALISKGGGIFDRSAKSIPLSPEIQAMLGVSDNAMSPLALINSLLKMDTDLLWFGGIGTYVKAEAETNAEVGDRANDSLRVNATELRVKVIGEGGNLGMTQLSRIEFSANGGRLNTDFIDNAAGVDCSDHEVNIKILLDQVMARGDLSADDRNRLLAEMTEDVAAHVLEHNYRQTQALSLACHDVVPRLEEYRRLMSHMEGEGKLNRALEYLPEDESFIERKSRGTGLTRPELSVLISYVKGELKESLNVDELVNDEGLAREVESVFPKRLVDTYREDIQKHQLRKEIIATKVANDMVNHMGITFVDRLSTSTGATDPVIARAYIIAKDVFQLDKWWARIEALDHKVPAMLQLEMMSELTALIRRACRWLIRNRRSEMHITNDQARFKKDVEYISERLSSFLNGAVSTFWQQRFDELVEAGVDAELARFIAGAPFIYAALGIIEANTGDELERVVKLYYALGERLDLNWFEQQIHRLKPNSYWQALAREAFREDLEWQQRSITAALLAMPDAPTNEVEHVTLWVDTHPELVARWQQTTTEIKATSEHDFSMFSVALRELLDLAQSSTHRATE